MKKSLLTALLTALLLVLPSQPMAALISPDGSLALSSKEVQAMQECMAAGGLGCFLVNKDMLVEFGEAYAKEAVQNAVQEMGQRFHEEVKKRAGEVAEHICRNNI
jgi:hypothetical protein